jgi:hypothetical protein
MIALTLLLTATSTAPSEGWLRQVIAGQRGLPALAEVQRAAVVSLGLPSLDDVNGWEGRARWRGALPRLDLSIGTDSDLDIRDSFSTSSSRVTVAGRAFVARAAARWDLGLLLAGDLERRTAREATARAAVVRLVVEEVTRLYFERVELLAAPAGDPTLAARAALLDGLLDGHTGRRLRWPYTGKGQ